MIAADLLATDATGDVHEHLAEATAFGITMKIVDVELQPDQRSGLLSDLPGRPSAMDGAKRDGINAGYSLALDPGAMA